MPIEVKVLAFGDFLFFMELRIKEVLQPFLVSCYDSRLQIIKKFVKASRSAILADPQEQFPALKDIIKFDSLLSIKNKNNF
jgi:hypothetical protein